MIEGRGERVEVAARVRARALYLFQRRVGGRVADDARGQGRRLCRVAFGESKVEKDNLAARAELEVLRLDVAVYDRRLLRVQVVERVEELVGPCEHLRGGGQAALALAPHLFDVGAFDELHDEELTVAFREVVAHARERRVRETREQSGLSLELTTQFFVAERSLFERDRRIEAFVRR